MGLADGSQQHVQTRLDFSTPLTGEARGAGREETESSGATNESERPAGTDRLIEEVCERDNLKEALQRVKANKGSAGVDGMTTGDLTDYLKQHWPAIRVRLLNGTYEPKPVRRVEIPKPDGGVRKLGIPTVLDRFIQQAVLQVLQRRWDGVEHYMTTGHGTNAAIAAGYGRRSAHVTASRLLRKAKIQRAIQARRAADPRIMTRVEPQQFGTAVWA